jgi:hypothetical protein
MVSSEMIGGDPDDGDPEQSGLFEAMYRELEEHGFTLIPLPEARRRTADLRNLYAPRMEYLIDDLVAPRGFWGHVVGHRRQSDTPVEDL